MLCSIFGALLIHSCPWIFKGHGQYCRRIFHSPWVNNCSPSCFNQSLSQIALRFFLYIFFSVSQSKVLEEPAELSPSLIRSWRNHGAQENHFLEMFFTMGKKREFSTFESVMNRCIQPSTARASASGYLQDCPRQFSGRSFKWRNWNPSPKDSHFCHLNGNMLVHTAHSQCLDVFGQTQMMPMIMVDYLMPYPILYIIISYYIPMKSNCCLLKWNLKNWMEIHRETTIADRLADRLADLRSGLSHLAHLHGRPATGERHRSTPDPWAQPRPGRKRSVPRWGWKPPPQGASSHWSGQWYKIY